MILCLFSNFICRQMCGRKKNSVSLKIVELYLKTRLNLNWRNQTGFCRISCLNIHYITFAWFFKNEGVSIVILDLTDFQWNNSIDWTHDVRFRSNHGLELFPPELHWCCLHLRERYNGKKIVKIAVHARRGDYLITQVISKQHSKHFKG